MDASFAKARGARSVRFIWPATLPGTLWRRLYANTVCHARSVARQRRPLVKRTREGPASRQGEIQKNGESRVHRRRRGAGFRLSGGSGGMRLTTARRVACALYRAVCHIRQLHTMRSCWSAEQPASLHAPWPPSKAHAERECRGAPGMEGQGSDDTVHLALAPPSAPYLSLSEKTHTGGRREPADRGQMCYTT
jgi:hypothetical protein